MLVFIVEPDHVRANAIARALATRGAAVACAHDFASAEALLTGRTRPGVVYVADRVPPLAGADLLPLVERNARMSGVRLVAAVRDDASLLAAALRRGGVHVVTDALDPDQIGALLASLASTDDDAADWRATALAWSRRVARNRARLHRRRGLAYRRASALAFDRLLRLRARARRQAR